MAGEVAGGETRASGWSWRWAAVAMLLLALMAGQELRWQLHQPLRLSGISHAVNVPPEQPLTVGYAVQNTSNLPLTIEAIEVSGAHDRRGITDTVRLDVLSVSMTTGQRPTPARPGTPFELGLTTRPIEGQRLAPGEELTLAVTYVGTGPGRFGAGPMVARYRFGLWSREQRVMLSDGHHEIRVARDGVQSGG